MKGLLRFGDWSLRAKLAGLLVAASLLPVLASTVLDIHDARALLLSDAAALVASRGDQLVGKLDASIVNYQRSAERFTHVPEAFKIEDISGAIRKPEDLAPLQKMLGILPANDPNVAAVGILDHAGVVKAASDPRLVGLNLASDAFVRRGLKGKPATSDVYFSELEGLPAIAVAAPIGDAGSAGGLVVVWVRASSLWDLMRTSNELAGRGSYAVLFDRLGIRIGHSASNDVLFHPAASLDPATLTELVAQRRFGPGTRELLADVRSFPEYRRSVTQTFDRDAFEGIAPVNGTVNYGVERRLSAVPWTLFYMIPEDSLLAHLSPMLHRKLLLSAVIAMTALLAGTLFSASVVAPIRPLSKATKQLGSGDLSSRVPVSRADELGRLGQSFNEMADRIESQARELQRAHDELDARVQERTAELVRAASNLEREVTERTRAEEASRASELLLQGIVESSDDAIISKTLSGVITSWNPGAERLFGYSAGDAIGKSMLMLFPPERTDEETEILNRVTRGEFVDHYETVRVRADGTRVDISATISPLKDAQGRIVGASKIARDITEGKTRERKLRARLERLRLLQQITRAIAERQDLHSILQVMVDALEEHLPIDFGSTSLGNAGGHFLTVNCVGRRSTETARALDLSERTRIEIDRDGLARCLRGQLVYEPDLSEDPQRFAQRLLRGGMRSAVIAPLAAHSDIFGILVVARRRPEAFSSGECEFLQQITEHAALAAQHAELHEALRTAYAELQRTQQGAMQQERLRALGEMASGIAHDINNAISPVSLYTDLLLDRETALSERGRDYLKIIQRAIEDVAATVARMREFYREREPQAELRPVQLNTLVAQVLDLTRARWSDMALRRGIVIHVSTELPSDLPKIVGVESEFREALTNLVLNAADAMPDGGTITLRTRSSEQSVPGDGTPAKRVCLEVADTGTGMDEATRRRCLEPFFTTKGERGTGLGLAMVYGAVQRHGGDIEIASAPGCGTRISLSFPLPGSSPATQVRPGAVLPPATSLRVLVVDDDPVLRKSLCDCLANHGHMPVAASGGQAGVVAFHSALSRGDPFSAVITDLGMPHVDGRKVAMEVKLSSPLTPVILLTGWGQRLVAENDVPPHVDRVLSKPPRWTELQSLLAELTNPPH